MHEFPALRFAQSLMSTPTAPFREHWMCATLDRLLLAIEGVEVKADAHGNRWAWLRGGRTDVPPTVEVAHLDHPGFLIHGGDGHVHQATFEGGVHDEYFPGAPVRLFRSADDEGVPGSVRECGEPKKGDGFREAVIETEQEIHGAQLAMWDFPAWEVEGELLKSRACDDLGGCAAILGAMETVAQVPFEERPTLIGLFTRAEEAGFCGAICAAADGAVPREALVISVETSSARAATPLGCGAIIRVGDKMTTFDRGVLDLMWAGTEALRTSGELVAVRALMDGGTCEATPFVAHGLKTGAACVPLANYHNMDTDRRCVAPEAISLHDLEMLSRLLAAVPMAAATSDFEAKLRERLKRRERWGRDRLEHIPVDFG